MIHEEEPAVDEEVPAAIDEEGDAEDVYGDAPPVDTYRLSSSPGVVGGGS